MSEKAPIIKLPSVTFWVSRERAPDGTLNNTVDVWTEKPERLVVNGVLTWYGYFYCKYWVAGFNLAVPDDENMLIRVG